MLHYWAGLDKKGKKSQKSQNLAAHEAPTSLHKAQQSEFFWDWSWRKSMNHMIFKALFSYLKYEFLTPLPWEIRLWCKQLKILLIEDYYLSLSIWIETFTTVREPNCEKKEKKDLGLTYNKGYSFVTKVVGSSRYYSSAPLPPKRKEFKKKTKKQKNLSLESKLIDQPTHLSEEDKLWCWWLYQRLEQIENCPICLSSEDVGIWTLNVILD